MQSDLDLSRSLALLAESKKLVFGKRKNTGGHALLANCINKYPLLGSDRAMELFQHLKPDVNISLLKLMKSPDLKKMLVFALCLNSTGCTVPSKIWREVKAGATDRYKELAASAWIPWLARRRATPRCHTRKRQLKRLAPTNWRRTCGRRRSSRH